MRIQGNAPAFHKSGALDLVFKVWSDKQGQPRYAKYTSSMKTDNYFVRMGTEGDFQPAAPVGPTEVVTPQDFQTPFYKDIYPRIYALAFIVEDLAKESDKHGIISDKGRKMFRAIERAMELDAAEFMTLGTTTSVATPDGLALFSAAHLLQTGTASNIVTGNPALSVVSLAQACQELLKQTWHTGEYVDSMGKYNLLVPPDLADLANRLVNATKYPTTNNNDPNWGGGQIGEVIVNPYFTSTTAWALVPAEKDENPLKIVTRRGVVNLEQPLIDVGGGATKYVSNKVWAKFPMDWRRTIYSAGA